jgi:hypothetical protein
MVVNLRMAYHSGDAVAEDRHVRESSAPLGVVSFEWPRYQEAGLGRVAS